MTIPKSGSSVPKTPRGFTIIELLVVVSIMSLLVTLLLPSLTKAREAALHVQCSGQLHSQGVAHAAYQADNHQFFPSFGGTLSTNGYGMETTQNDGGISLTSFWSIDNNNGSMMYFNDYLNGGNPPNRRLQNASYCPAINWRTWQPNVFSLGNYMVYLQSPLPGAWAGYNFYTGRKFWDVNQTYWWDEYEYYDTRVRRDDPREILVTDLVTEVFATQGSAYLNGSLLTVSPAYPWFNPHVGNGNTTTRQGSAHQLRADGAVTTFNVIDAYLTSYYNSATMANYADADTTTPTAVVGSDITGHYYTAHVH